MTLNPPITTSSAGWLMMKREQKCVSIRDPLAGLTRWKDTHNFQSWLPSFPVPWSSVYLGNKSEPSACANVSSGGGSWGRWGQRAGVMNGKFSPGPVVNISLLKGNPWITWRLLWGECLFMHTYLYTFLHFFILFHFCSMPSQDDQI